MTTTLARETFSTSRLMEFFTEKELQMQIGHAPRLWPLALVKELVDNALDACEGAGVLPCIGIDVAADAVTVADNGPGLPAATLERSLDYMVRVSDKAHYVSPTRGQLGNALKCLWAAPFVATGERGRVEVRTGGRRHEIEVALDRIAQRPDLQHCVDANADVKNGTMIRLHWPGIACYLGGGETSKLYKGDPDLFSLVSSYGAFNPHATFRLKDGDEEDTWATAAPDWRKWRTDMPTPPHWYSVERLAQLIAAYVTQERNGGRRRTVREFVAEFAGLSGTAKQKAVTAAAGLTGAALADLVRDGDVDRAAVRGLLAAMQDVARPVKPAALGVLGEEHLAGHMTAWRFVQPESVHYRKVEGVTVDGLPFVLEVAFGVNRPECEDYPRELVVGLNWSPVLRDPLPHLPRLLGEARVDAHDPVVVVVHLVCPRLDYVDRGKTTLALPPEIVEALSASVRTVTKRWQTLKRQADRDNRLRQRDVEEARRDRRRHQLTAKEAVFQVMERAYMKASANGTLPANARQVMYAARPWVLELTGKQTPWKDSAYFTQTLLPDFMEGNPDLTAGWDVVFDDRGHFLEPHTGHRIGLGTLAVRNYLDRWHRDVPTTLPASVPEPCPTSGPANRYRFALFIEKEGFTELLAAARIAQRFDLAIMSTKGMSVTAARHLVDRLSQEGVTILVARDFDKAGFSIVHTLRTNTRRYRFSAPPRVIDLGLRLDDVRALGLPAEAVEYSGRQDPRRNLKESGATVEECSFLVRSRQWETGWSGERVELNAMTSPQFIHWLEGKLSAQGVRKFVPGDEQLQHAYRRAWRLAIGKDASDRAVSGLRDDEIDVPPGLEAEVAAAINGTDRAWDAVVWDLAQRDTERRT